jgi:hypothetical protein
MQLRHEDQLRDLQNHFQGLLEQKIIQLQDDASDQIRHLKNQERELQSILEEKMIQLEKEYVKVSFHEEVVEEKDSIIEKLKQEISNRDNENRQEMANRLKNLEEKLTEDFNLTERKLKSNRIKNPPNF